MNDLFNHEWYNQTTLHPLGLTAVIVLGAAMLIVPRRHVIVPMLLMACFIAPAQRIVVFTLDFNLLRIMILFGWARLLMSGDWLHLRWKVVDWAVVAWVLVSVTAMTALHGTMGAFVNRLGFAFDALGAYFLFRCLIRNWSDVVAFGTAAAFITIPVSIVFLIEKSTGRNAFAIFGGVPEVTQLRSGKLRCTGAFAHPILAGSFWVCLMPIIAVGWWRQSWLRIMAPIGLACSMVMVITCNSSTPLIALIIGVFVAALYPLRAWLGVFRWSLLIGLIVLQAMMNNPIWHLIARMDLVGGSQGWHRYLLLDEFIRRVDEWWLFGVTSTQQWHELGLGDITNQYVLEGVQGGIGTLVLFLVTIVLCFLSVGQVCRRAGGRAIRRAIGWALGLCLLLHTIIFFGTSYFGQISMIWYLTLAMIASLSPHVPVQWHRRCLTISEQLSPPHRRHVRARPGLRMSGRRAVANLVQPHLRTPRRGYAQ